METQVTKCLDCGWQSEPYAVMGGTPSPIGCPECGSANLRADEADKEQKRVSRD